MADTYFDDLTLVKVYAVLERHGISGQKAIDLIFDLQNDGILFRESR